MKNTGNIIILVVLVVLAASIYVLYKMFQTKEELTARQRKALNFIIDLLRKAFHILYVIYIFPFINDNQDLILFYIAFWLSLASFAIFTVRIILKWGHFYCGTGSGKKSLNIWAKPFQMDNKKAKEQYEMI